MFRSLLTVNYNNSITQVIIRYENKLNFFAHAATGLNVVSPVLMIKWT